jgi:TrmH family RNA methyltransferase
MITSRSNPRIREIRCLLQRKHRDRARLFLIEGTRLVEQAADAGLDIVNLLLAPDLLSEASRSLVSRVISRGAPSVIEVAPEVLLSISPQHGHQGLLAVARQRWQPLSTLAPRSGDCFVAAKELRGPWTIGTILRTVDAVGGRGLLLLGRSADPHHPVAVRASLGAIFRLPLVRTDLDELHGWTQHHRLHVIGTSPAGPSDYREVPYRRPLLLFLGSERVGLSPEERAICDVTVSIPMLGRCESHHVAVAAALVLYQALGPNCAPP